ncbi:hypothetical protein CFP56_013779 [Quercus suber]|uniref:Uncharacterized protein n=1 Tax=Quercus suber TaxID=58331 RepID=A0AAW0M2S1_QUESU
MSLLAVASEEINRELQTTLTEEAAIAAPAVHGGKRNPVNGKMTPAAIGIPSILYPKAQT